MKEEKKENNFERLLKQKTEGVELSPSPLVWENVNTTLQNRRRKKIFVWMLSAILIVSTVCGYFLLFGNKPTSIFNAKSSTQNPRLHKEDKTVVTIDQSNSRDNNQANRKPEAEKNIVQNSDANEIQKPLLHSTHLTEKKDAVSKKNIPGSLSSFNSQKEYSPNNSELISPLTMKQLNDLSFNENTSKLTSLTTDFNIASSHTHHSDLYIEAEGMPLMSVVWNRYSNSGGTAQLLLAPPASDSYSFAKGFSAGGNIYGLINHKWIAGGGIHYTKTHQEAIANQELTTQYTIDTVSYSVDSVLLLNMQTQHAVVQWLDFTVFAGVQLFTSSQNHLQIRAGAGWSHVLHSSVSSNESSSTYFDNSVSGTAGNIPITSNPVFDYHANQLQLFSDLSYVRNLSSRLSVTGGIEAHYLPFDLITNEEVNQHLLWLGAKAGLILRL